MLIRRSVLVLVGCCILSGSIGILAAAADVDEKTALAVETLLRLPATELERNPKFKDTVLRILERTRGTPSFVKLVEHFQLADQTAGLLEVITAQPEGMSAPSVEATRLLLGGSPEPLRQTLSGPNTNLALKLTAA